MSELRDIGNTALNTFGNTIGNVVDTTKYATKAASNATEAASNVTQVVSNVTGIAANNTKGAVIRSDGNTEKTKQRVNVAVTQAKTDAAKQIADLEAQIAAANDSDVIKELEKRLVDEKRRKNTLMDKYNNNQDTITGSVLGNMARAEEVNKRYRDIGFQIYNNRYYYLYGKAPGIFKHDVYRIISLGQDQTHIPLDIVYNNEENFYQYISDDKEITITPVDLRSYTPKNNRIFINRQEYPVNFRLLGKYDKKDYDKELKTVLSQHNRKPKIGGKTKRIRRRNKSKTKKKSIRKKTKKRRRTIKKKM